MVPKRLQNLQMVKYFQKNVSSSHNDPPISDEIHSAQSSEIDMRLKPNQHKVKKEYHLFEFITLNSTTGGFSKVLFQFQRLTSEFMYTNKLKASPC